MLHKPIRSLFGVGGRIGLYENEIQGLPRELMRRASDSSRGLQADILQEGVDRIFQARSAEGSVECKAYRETPM